MSRLERKLEETMQRGGFGFWILCVVFSLGFYGLLWFLMALGSAVGY
jgi:hypothetical protein